MKRIDADIDIDMNDRHELLKHVPHIDGRDKNGNRHQTGIYFQRIPFNEQTNISKLDSETAQKEGYFKIDFLNLSVYSQISSNEQLVELLDQKTDWSLLKDREIVENLLHVSKYYDRLQNFHIDSIEDMAIFLALIRPAKMYLFGKSKEYIQKKIWEPPSDGAYYYKKSHAYSYAMVVKLQLNLITYKNKYNRVLDLIGDNQK